MCEFCSKHKRKRWFLDADNYHEIMLENKKRQNVLQKIGQGWEYYIRDTKSMVEASRIPVVGGLAKPILNSLIKYEHSGQVIDLDDALKVIDLAENHVIFPCACRKMTGLTEKMCCINFGPMKDLAINPNEKKEEVDTEELKLRLKDWFDEGLFLQILYATAPYPIALCACERKYCFSCKLRFIFDFHKSLLKGHDVAVVNPLKCKGDNCNFACLHRCSFGAMFIDQINMKVVVDPTRCFGCGLCAGECKNNALRMVSREAVPSARGKW